MPGQDTCDNVSAGQCDTGTRSPGPLLLHGRPSPPQLALLSRSLRLRRCFRRPGGNPVRVPLYVVLTRARNKTLLLLFGDGLPARVAPLANLAPSPPSCPSRTTVRARCASPQRGPATERAAKVLAHSPPSRPLPDGARPDRLQRRRGDCLAITSCSECGRAQLSRRPRVGPRVGQTAGSQLALNGCEDAYLWTRNPRKTGVFQGIFSLATLLWSWVSGVRIPSLTP